MSQAGIVVKQVSTGGAISSSSGEKKKNTDVGSLGGGRKKDYPLQNSIRKVFSPIWLTDLQHNPAQLDRGVEGEEEEKRQQQKKKIPQEDTSILYISANRF